LLLFYPHLFLEMIIVIDILEKPDLMDNSEKSDLSCWFSIFMYFRIVIFSVPFRQAVIFLLAFSNFSYLQAWM